MFYFWDDFKHIFDNFLFNNFIFNSFQLFCKIFHNFIHSLLKIHDKQIREINQINLKKKHASKITQQNLFKNLWKIIHPFIIKSQAIIHSTTFQSFRIIWLWIQLHLFLFVWLFSNKFSQILSVFPNVFLSRLN